MSQPYTCPVCKRKTYDRCRSLEEALRRGDKECAKAAPLYYPDNKRLTEELRKSDSHDKAAD